MHKTIFNSQLYLWSLIIFILINFFWNLFITISTSQLLGILPLAIQAILLTLILTRHKYAKPGIKIWAILFLIISSSLKFLGRLLQDIGYDFKNPDPNFYIEMAQP